MKVIIPQTTVYRIQDDDTCQLLYGEWIYQPIYNLFLAIIYLL